MAIPVVEFSYDGEELYSPFSGEPVEGEGVNLDSTVLFVYYGDASVYTSTPRGQRIAVECGIDDHEEMGPVELLQELTAEGALAFRVDAGWNGVNYYVFAPN